ncbi:YceI family protein [Aquisalinus flavus]|uniref:Lipid/polyisoprenoid-binding YceI-like domain-containing protein n=1 Tax=Aquisalinus flavus TaxID=1526572 RepID=A0A8J2V286_9PROT|nr:YceI family protein [Aquisalinus flavus]MBD0427146.1 YceI family protein [Aquisalinus flavus]UNE46966.1 YceI family protein [Aquisalinus flavus]GGC98721.1 hypothetical protein GCM10011342_04590 [Aquisalinus flavus]
MTSLFANAAAALAMLAVVGCGNASEDIRDAETAAPTEEAGQATAQTGAADTAPEGADVWTLDPAASSVTFTATQQGEEFTGRFDSFSADIRLDPENLSGAMIEARIDMASVDAGSTDRNDALPTNDWFAVKKFPEATFQSSEITSLGGGQYEAAGTLTIKGTSQPATLPFTLTIEGDTAMATGTLELTRTDYNVGTGAYEDGKWVGLPVTVTVDITASR